jgi:DNA helicase TIP49 (TBP-interacting protein)
VFEDNWLKMALADDGYAVVMEWIKGPDPERGGIHALLLEGETGSGKTALASLPHRLSARRDDRSS